MAGTREQARINGKKGGRPKGSDADREKLRQLTRKHTPDAITVIVSVMRNEKASDQARIAAAREILDRGYGKAVQPVSDPEGSALTMPPSIQFVIQQQPGAENHE